MRRAGRITTWKDEQGFGFIKPNAGGEPLFVHVTAFQNRQRRPVEKELVTYEPGTDDRGRKRAEHVFFVNNPAELQRPRNLGAFVFPGIFAAVLGVSVLVGKLPVYIPAFYLVASVVAYVEYARDKTAAKNNRWRTTEETLHLLGLFGGWPGALVAQGVLRHKSKKQSFQLVFWATVVLNCIALMFFLSPSSMETVRSFLAKHR